MLTTDKRIELLVRLGEYMLSDSEEWQIAKERAIAANAWFTQGHIDAASDNIARNFLQADKLKKWIAAYKPAEHAKKTGIVMAGNIPMVGFHDLLCGFIMGHELYIKLSSKDEVLMKHIVQKLIEWEPNAAQQLYIAERLKDCDAYIATGSNNSSRYFEQYFGRYPHIIRRNRTSVAVLDGTETDEELKLLADDIYNYFGLGCRNVTKVLLPEGYDIKKLMIAFEVYKDIVNHNKYKNNYDYYLAIYLLNKVPFYTNENILMVENASPFTAVSVLHYEFYNNKAQLIEKLKDNADIQCIVGHENLPFGKAQQPALSDYADGIDTMLFLQNL